MAYEFHYPPKQEDHNEWHEEGKEPKQSLDDYMKDAEAESKMHSKYYGDYSFLRDDYNDHTFESALDTLCDVEIITAKERDDYVQSRELLHTALKAEVAPYDFSKDSGECAFFGGVLGMVAGLVVSGGALLAYSACGYDSEPYAHLLLLSAIGAIVPGAILTYLGVSRSAKKKLAEAKKIDLDKAYEDFLDSLEPFRDFTVENRNYDKEKIKKYDRKDIFEAVEDVRQYMDYLAGKKQFIPE